MDRDGGNVRQLCFEQDHDFNPVMMDDGRVLYLRWEYADLPHSNSRRLFTMNPDGTGQGVYYGRNSYWPNGVFGARPIPGRPGQVIGIVAGHHGSHREGELVLFDVYRGRQEADGVVQRIPGRGHKVEPLVRDELTAASWPKFAHPFPLSDKYFLVSCKLNSTAPWDLYLVDVFDNLLPLYHVDDYALFEPIPIKARPRPPIIPDQIDPKKNEALVYLVDVYRGPGLSGVPRGAVKRLRLFTYHYAYQGMGGLLGTVGLDGPWDIKRILGTVPVEADGSALFRIPANTPISLQPLDEQGKALQLMRSWLVGMPGETVSCAGCHEDQQSVSPVNLDTIARRTAANPIQPWYGPARNFSFQREVQPVVDRYCLGCHDGPRGVEPDLRGTVLTSDYRSSIAGNGGGPGGRYFSVGYFELSRLVRRPGIESDMHMLRPGEYHADQTDLVRLLLKGHHQVRLDAESWDRLITWIDLNAPYHGTWTEIGWNPGRQRERRRQLRKLYAGVDEDPEALAAQAPPRVAPILPKTTPAATPVKVYCPDWPFTPQEAARRQAAAGLVTRRSIELGSGVKMDLALIPTGQFVMGDPAGDADEQPLTPVKIDRPYWLGVCEVTNRQYALFDPAHDSRFESKNGYQFGVTGFDLNRPEQPVVRVSWQRALAFCDWLTRQTGIRFTLPTEVQWEYACRAGSATAFSFGDLGTDFSAHANLADMTLQQFVTDPYTVYKALPNPGRYDDWIPHDRRWRDGGLVTVGVGGYRPNAWGLHDMHGNAAEWTLTTYRPYPCYSEEGRDNSVPEGQKVVRGGSWRDRPAFCRSGFRWRYPAWQGVYNVGFRVAAWEKR
jgi:formylglycine-generating enzyme required for sulfatase activity